MAASVFDPFQVLGVARTATREQIRAAYRELVARYHPDKHRGNPLEELAAAKLIEINRAYEILSDDLRRAAYEGQRPPVARSTASAEVIAHDKGAKILRTVVAIVAVLVLVRFGLSLSGQMLALVRGLLVGVLSLFRLGPIPAIAVLIVLGMVVSFVLRSRKNR